jgi:lipoprotein-releasing system ATP-binding protein
VAELVIENVEKEYPTRGEPLKVLRGVSLSLQAGQNAAILGPSGSGKSTLLHIAGALETPTSGRLELNGCDPFALSEPELAQFRNENIGFIFQDHHLLPQLSVLENVLIPSLASGSPSSETIDRAGDLLKRVGLSQRVDHRPAELSGGERQRVAVARALLLVPSLLLADEPTGSLDRRTAHEVSELLLRLQKEENNILLVVTHSLELADAMQARHEINDGLLSQITSS